MSTQTIRTAVAPSLALQLSFRFVPPGARMQALDESPTASMAPPLLSVSAALQALDEFVLHAREGRRPGTPSGARVRELHVASPLAIVVALPDLGAGIGGLVGWCSACS